MGIRWSVNVKTFERCFNEWIDREMGNIVDAVEDRIQNAILTAIDNVLTPRIEVAVRSKYASYTREATSVAANSERGECIEFNTSFKNVSENNITLHALILHETHEVHQYMHFMRLEYCGRGKWIVSHSNSFWPAPTLSSQWPSVSSEHEVKTEKFGWNCEKWCLPIILDDITISESWRSFGAFTREIEFWTKSWLF